MQNNPLFFWLGLVVAIVGLGATVYYLFGPQLHVKHAIVTFLVAVAGGVAASFARPRRAIF
jgi:hypothetical protein